LRDSGWSRLWLQWIVRNLVVFRGRFLYSTLSGHDAVEGVFIETDASSCLSFPSEAALNREASSAARKLWRGIWLA
jgi:hypothetical protein